VDNAHPIDPDRFEWDAWRPEQAAQLLARVDAPWYVAAGWAIDLFLGEERRVHEDLEIAVPGERFGEVAHALREFEIFVIEPGLATPLAHASSELLAETHQTWVLDRAAGVWRLDVFREPSEGEVWLSRRDESIRLPYDRVIARSKDGIPYGRPEVVLLFKAKHARPKDDRDFTAVLPLLDPPARRWLIDALELVHPGHRWLADLSRPGHPG
jgi:Aminoglycoside-2''-adenylyltransferase